MAYGDYVWLPTVDIDESIQYPNKPTAESIYTDGLEIGSNERGRNGWVLGAKYSDDMTIKAAYYFPGPESEYAYIVVATNVNTYYSGRRDTTMLWECKYIPATGYSVDDVWWTNGTPTAPSGTYVGQNDTIYYRTGIGQVKAGSPAIGGEMVDGIPYYNSWLEALEAMDDGIWIKPENPYDPGGGGTGTGGGGGIITDTSVKIPAPTGPGVSAVDTGFITLYNPTLTEVRALANYLWSDLFDLETFKKLFADPMDAIIGLSLLPVDVPGGTPRQIKVGNIDVPVTMTPASSQYVIKDCGTVAIRELIGAYTDYDPYTKVEIFLPYCGTHQLQTDDVMNKDVSVRYIIDILSGACTASVSADGSVMYTFSGNCASSVPFTSVNYTNTIRAALQVAGSMVQAAAVPASDGAAAASIVSAAQTAIGGKPTIVKSGNIAGSNGQLAVQTPYIMITRPQSAVPKDQQKYTGYPSAMTLRLGDLTGMTVVESIHLDGIPATSEEIDEIENLLKSGVVL